MQGKNKILVKISSYHKFKSILYKRPGERKVLSYLTFLETLNNGGQWARRDLKGVECMSSMKRY